MRKKLFMVSLGCPKNLVDSEVMLGILEKEGMEVCENARDADILLINTCGFIRNAVEESIDEILGLAKVKEKKPHAMLIVTGCLVQRYGEQLRDELPEVDLFIGTDGFQNIVGHIAAFSKGHEKFLHRDDPRYIMSTNTPRRVSTPPHRAYLKITEGCMNRCSYCLIPSIRGPLRSRGLEDLLAEVQNLEKSGVRELTLIGQDITTYGLDMGAGGPRLIHLLKELTRNSTIPWIRLLYLHPQRLQEDILSTMKNNSKIVPYLDIPMQHVSSRILHLMNRSYDKIYLENLLSTIRDKMSSTAIRATFITGFPGESEDDFGELREFVLKQQFDHVGVFSYSNEEGTVASQLEDQLPEEIREERRSEIMKLQAPVSHKKNLAMVGKKLDVLIEGLSRETDLLLEGRTSFQAPDIDGCVYIASGKADPGDIVQVHITEAHPYDLVGEIVSPT